MRCRYIPEAFIAFLIVMIMLLSFYSFIVTLVLFGILLFTVGPSGSSKRLTVGPSGSSKRFELHSNGGYYE